MGRGRIREIRMKQRTRKRKLEGEKANCKREMINEGTRQREVEKKEKKFSWEMGGKIDESDKREREGKETQMTLLAGEREALEDGRREEGRRMGSGEGSW